MSALGIGDVLTVGSFLVGFGAVLGHFRSITRAFREHADEDQRQFSKIHDTLADVREGVAELRGRQT